MSHRDLRFWDVAHLLMEKYDFTQEDADGLSNFLLPMLAFDPKERATARACADHPWVFVDAAAAVGVGVAAGAAGAAAASSSSAGEGGEDGV